MEAVARTTSGTRPRRRRGIALVAIPAASPPSPRAQSGGNIVTAATDFLPPPVTAAVVGKSLAAPPASSNRAATYFVYANVSADTGNPASGIATVKANVAEITTGQTAVRPDRGLLHRRRRLLRLPQRRTRREHEPSRRANLLGHRNRQRRQRRHPRRHGHRRQHAADRDRRPDANGGTNGLAEEGDTLTYTFSEPIEPHRSSPAGPARRPTSWCGSSTTACSGSPLGNDERPGLQLGQHDRPAARLGRPRPQRLRRRPARRQRQLRRQRNQIDDDDERQHDDDRPRHLRSAKASSVAAGAPPARQPDDVWTPVATPYDRAANAMSATPATESGAADKEF